MGKEQLNLKLRLMFTPLLHKDVVESTACPHQKAVSTFLPPAQRAFLRAMRLSEPAAGPEGAAGHYF